MPQTQTPTVEPPEEVAADFEAIDEVEEEWDDEETPENGQNSLSRQRTRSVCGEEIKALREFKSLATSIVKNSKGEVLFTALKKGFAKAREWVRRKRPSFLRNPPARKNTCRRSWNRRPMPGK